MQAAQQNELEAMTDMFNKCAIAAASTSSTVSITTSEPVAESTPTPFRPPLAG